MEKIRVIVYKADKRPEIKKIPNTLESMQELVGGYLEIIRLKPEGLIIVCNEEGRILNLPYNRGFRGTFFVVADHGEEFRSLTEAELLRTLMILPLENFKEDE